jgi:hypothetical protein
MGRRASELITVLLIADYFRNEAQEAIKVEK